MDFLEKASLDDLLGLKHTLNEYFSKNESFDEVKTADIPYLATDYLLAKRMLEVNGNSHSMQDKEKRVEILTQAKQSYNDFFDWLCLFRLGDRPSHVEVPRDVKINRMRLIKSMKDELSLGLKEDADEEVKRQYHVTWIAHLGLLASDEYTFVLRELDLLKQDDSFDIGLRANNLEKHPTVRVDKPFVLTSKREQLKLGVFRPSHSLPTMTIDEYLKLEMKRGNVIKGTGDVEKKDPEKDADFDAETRKLRVRDERWDWIRRGSGNTYNRS